MADGRDSAKIDGPRYEALTGGRGTEFYIARKEFGFTVEEWNALPGWQTQMYIHEHAEFLKARSGKSSPSKPATGSPGDGGGAGVFDITSGAPVPPGFQTRRAG